MSIKKNITKTIYLPLEIFDRELGAAIILANEAARRGWTVILGGKQAVFNNMSRFVKSKGVFLLKSIVPGEVFKQEEIMSYGHRITSLDVEGLVRTPGSAGVNLRYSKESIEKCDIVFFWGQDHYNAVKNVYPTIENKSCISGHPIVDEILLNVENLKNNVITNSKKKILIATSCGIANHINGTDFFIEMSNNAGKNNLSKDEADILNLKVSLDLVVFDQWKKIIPKIAKEFKNYEVIVRPHPSENVDFWRVFLKDHKNVRINSATPILDELIKTDLFIHFGSTTSITSNLLKIPTLMPMPKLRPELYDRVTFVKNICKTTESIEELIYSIKEALNNNLKLNNNNNNISHYCENLKPDRPSASESIMNKIEEFYNINNNVPKFVNQDFAEKSRTYLRKVKFRILWIISIIFNTLGLKKMKMLPHVNSFKASKAKQPKVKLKKIKLLTQKLIDDNDFKKLSIIQLSQNLFKIETSEK